MTEISDTLQQQLEAVAAKYRGALLAMPGILDLGVGFRQRGKVLTDEPTLVVRVSRKVTADKLTEDTAMPSSLDGIPVDVQEVHEVSHALPTDRASQLVGGLYIRNVKRGGLGTLGAIVRDRTTGHLLGLSNHHVLLGRHFLFWGGRLGDAVVQPGSSRSDADVIGTVLRGAPWVDAAAFKIDGARPADPATSLLGLKGRFAGVRDAKLGLRVVKSGARTGVTYGYVSFVSTLTVTIAPVADRPALNGEISMAGDSGAVWASYEPDLRAVALHRVGHDGNAATEWAGGNLIARVADALGVDF